MSDHAICTAEGHGPQVSPLPKLHHHGPHGERVAHASWGNLGGDTKCVGCRAGYPLYAWSPLDVCADCHTPVATLRSVDLVGSDRGLAATYMPPGGCTCVGTGGEDRTCRRCFPGRILCQTCGEVAHEVSQPDLFGEVS